MRVILALDDDPAAARQALGLLLGEAGFEVVGEASDGPEAVRLARQHGPDVALIDVVLPLLNGIDAAREIQHASPGTRTVLMTSRRDEDPLLEAVDAGIWGCVEKPYHAPELIRAIREVAAGGVHLTPALSRRVADAYRVRSAMPPDPLSPREREVIRLIAQGQRAAEIARRLGVSVKTAESHRSHIMKKLDIHETEGLVRYALQHGFGQA